MMDEWRLFEDIYKKIEQDEQVWDRLDARSTGTELTLWFNAKAVTD
jgi:hypothetical protein